MRRRTGPSVLLGEIRIVWGLAVLGESGDPRWLVCAWGRVFESQIHKNFYQFFWLVQKTSIAYTPRMSLPGKTIGEIGELRFCANAMERGLVVSKPFGDNAPYDAITERDGVIRRIQVKSSNFWDRKGRHQNSRYYGFFLTKGMGRGQAYLEGDYDILAAYIIPEDATYLIPFEELAGKKKLLINLNEGTKYSKYREGWDLLEADQKLLNT